MHGREPPVLTRRVERVRRRTDRRVAHEQRGLRARRRSPRGAIRSGSRGTTTDRRASHARHERVELRVAAPLGELVIAHGIFAAAFDLARKRGTRSLRGRSARASGAGRARPRRACAAARAPRAVRAARARQVDVVAPGAALVDRRAPGSRATGRDTPRSRTAGSPARTGSGRTVRRRGRGTSRAAAACRRSGAVAARPIGEPPQRAEVARPSSRSDRAGRRAARRCPIAASGRAVGITTWRGEHRRDVVPPVRTRDARRGAHRAAAHAAAATVDGDGSGSGVAHSPTRHFVRSTCRSRRSSSVDGHRERRRRIATRRRGTSVSAGRVVVPDDGHRLDARGRCERRDALASASSASSGRATSEPEGATQREQCFVGTRVPTSRRPPRARRSMPSASASCLQRRHERRAPGSRPSVRSREQRGDPPNRDADPVGSVVELVTHLVERLLEHVGVELDAAGAAGRSASRPRAVHRVEVAAQERGRDPHRPTARRAREELFGALLAAHRAPRRPSRRSRHVAA